MTPCSANSRSRSRGNAIFQSCYHPLRSWFTDMWLMSRSQARAEPGMRRYSALSPRNGRSPWRWRPAVETRTTRRWRSGGPDAHGVVSNDGQSRLISSVRSGSSTSASRTMSRPHPRGSLVGRANQLSPARLRPPCSMVEASHQAVTRLPVRACRWPSARRHSQ